MWWNMNWNIDSSQLIKRIMREDILQVDKIKKKKKILEEILELLESFKTGIY